jgi:hypothetical protein
MQCASTIKTKHPLWFSIAPWEQQRTRHINHEPAGIDGNRLPALDAAILAYMVRAWAVAWSML